MLPRAHQRHRNPRAGFFNLPALWIPDSPAREGSHACRLHRGRDPATVIATHLTEVFKRHLADFLDRQAVQGLCSIPLPNIRPRLLRILSPIHLLIWAAQKVLQLLVRENVSIRDNMLTIVETLDDYAGGVKNRKSWPNMCVKNCPGPLCGPIWTARACCRC